MHALMLEAKQSVADEGGPFIYLPYKNLPHQRQWKPRTLADDRLPADRSCMEFVDFVLLKEFSAGSLHD